MSASKYYLVGYNTVQFLGWSWLFIQMIMHFVKGGTPDTIWQNVSDIVKLFQTLAIMEVAHGALGLVRSNPVVAFQQCFGRLNIIWLILELLPTSRLSIGVLLVLFAWTITELIRYPTYALNLLGMSPYFLTWLRYTFFIVAYPLGVLGELLCMYNGIDFAQSQGVFQVDLPNTLNATFYYPLVIVLEMLLYIPLFPPMYFHMFSQRKKVLGPQKEE